MRAFYAYPSSLVDVTQVIHAAERILSATRRDLELHLWEENDISGRPLTDPIFEGIAAADILVADITAVNFNVTFEIGYAIGLGKRIYLTCDRNIMRDRALADRIGIFDTLGFETYADERNLSELFKTYRSDGGIPLHSLLNLKSPVYVLQTPQSNWAMIAITGRIKKARLGNLCTGPAKGRMRKHGHCCRHQETSTTGECPPFDSESGAPQYPRGPVCGRLSLTGRTSPPQA